jgi:hypothetical protein
LYCGSLYIYCRVRKKIWFMAEFFFPLKKKTFILKIFVVLYQGFSKYNEL